MPKSTPGQLPQKPAFITYNTVGLVTVNYSDTV